MITKSDIDKRLKTIEKNYTTAEALMTNEDSINEVLKEMGHIEVYEADPEDEDNECDEIHLVPNNIIYGTEMAYAFKRMFPFLFDMEMNLNEGRVIFGVAKASN